MAAAPTATTVILLTEHHAVRVPFAGAETLHRPTSQSGTDQIVALYCVLLDPELRFASLHLADHGYRSTLCQVGSSGNDAKITQTHEGGGTCSACCS